MQEILQERHDSCNPRQNQLRNVCYGHNIVSRKRYAERKSNFIRYYDISNVKQTIISSVIC